MDCSSPPTEATPPLELLVCVTLMRSIPVEKSRYEGTNVPPPGAPQLDGIHLEVSSDPFEKLSKNVAPAGAAGALACNVPLTSKRVAKTKTIALIIEKISLSYRG